MTEPEATGQLTEPMATGQLTEPEATGQLTEPEATGQLAKSKETLQSRHGIKCRKYEQLIFVLCTGGEYNASSSEGSIPYLFRKHYFTARILLYRPHITLPPSLALPDRLLWALKLMYIKLPMHLFFLWSGK